MYERTAATRARILARHDSTNHRHCDDHDIIHQCSPIPESQGAWQVAFVHAQNFPPYAYVGTEVFDGTKWERQGETQ
jgi:hypothetical protein